MTHADLRAWQAERGYTYETAAAALGMSRSGYAKLVRGVVKIDRRTALACAAVALGIVEWQFLARDKSQNPAACSAQ